MISAAVYLVVVFASSLFAVAVAAWLWEDGADLAVRLFVALVGVLAATGLLVVGELLAPNRSLATGFYVLHSAVGGAVMSLWFLFTVAYTGHRRRLTRPVIGLVLGSYAIVAVLRVLDPVLGLMWSDFEVVSSPFPFVVGEPTPLSVFLLFPQSMLYFAGLGILGVHLLFGNGVRRAQTASLLAGFLPSLVIITVYFAGMPVGPLNGALVIGSTWTLGLAAWAVFRHQLFDLVPMARETVFEALDEMVLVVDRQRRLLDYNDAAVATFPELAGCDGDPVEAAIPELVTASERVTADVVEPNRGADVDDSDRGGDGDGPPADGEADRGAAPQTGDYEVLDAHTADDAGGFAGSFTRYSDAGRREYSVTVTGLQVDRSVEGFALVLRDVTERRQRVRALEQQTAQLERFASTLSHDLRNPLNVAMGRIDLAADADDEHLGKAGEALDRMEQIIQDTLRLAREGQTIEERERVDLAAIASDAWETTDTGGATLEVDPDAEVSVYADDTRLQSVFENLFRNSVEHGSTGSRTQSADAGSSAPMVRGGSATDGDVDAARDGAGTLTVRLDRHERGFSVEDDGRGVPPDEREQVFEYEFTTDDDGTGLGLAIVDAIARAHGWTVEMTEGSDGGARVVFSNVDFAENDRLPDDAA